MNQNKTTHKMSARFFWVSFWASLFFVAWCASPWRTLPGPLEVWSALGALWWEQGMGQELLTTLSLIAHAVLYTVALSMSLSYATVAPAMRPVIASVSKLRFLGLTGLVVPFTLLSGGGYALKLALLTFGMTTYFVTSMAQVVVEIPVSQFEQMQVLGASRLRTIWEVVIVGTLDKALEVLRQNVAIGWTLITMVEGLSRSDGGLGAMLLNENKHFLLPEVFAILLVILVVGLLLDASVVMLRRRLCPYIALS
jgi:ABC-type nitrate/sulfonate/bicarbonate transport system permease component